MLAYETDVTKTVDPFAGSYAVESLTNDVEAESRRLMEAVAERGGAVAAIEQGFQKAEIERSAYQVARQIDAGERVVVGVNRFQLDEEEPYEPLQVDPAIEVTQAASSPHCEQAETRLPLMLRSTRSEPLPGVSATCWSR